MEKSLKLKTIGPSYSIYWEGGGEVPKDLKGLYTSKGAAQEAIDVWQNKKPEPKRRLNRKVENGTKQD